MKGVITGALALALFAPEQKTPLLESVMDQVCNKKTYTYNTNERAFSVDGKTVYTSIGGKETPKGLLIYLNFIGDRVSAVILGYGEKGTDINNDRTYKLKPVPPGEAEEVIKLLQSGFAEHVPVSVVQCK